MVTKYKKPQKDTWVRDTAGTNKKVESYIKSQGGSEADVAGFKRFMDYKTANENQQREYAQKAQADWYTAHKESMRQQEEKKRQQEEEKKRKDKLTNFVGKAKNVALTGLEWLDRPADAIRTGIKEKAKGSSFWGGALDGLTGKKNTSGKEVNRALGFNPDKSKGVEEVVKFLARGFVGTSPGGLHTPIVNDKIAKKVGEETTGVLTETALDPLNLIGVGVVSKISSLKKAGKSVSQIAKELKVPVEVVEREFIKGTLPGQEIINTKALQLNAPKEDPLRFLTGKTESPSKDVLGLNEPIYSRKVEGLGKEVNVKGTLQLNAPRHTPIQSQEMDGILHNMEQVGKKRQVEESVFVQERMKPFDDMMKKSADAEHEWQSSVKQAKDMTTKLKDSYGKIIVPEGNWADWGHEVPVQFRAKRGETKGVDLYTFADNEGFSSVDEAVNFLKNLDGTSKTQLKDLKPADHMNISSNQYEELLKAARQEFNHSNTAKGLDTLFEDLNGMMKQYESTKQTGDPLAFVQSKLFKTKQEPLNYTGRMNPKDASAVRSEGEFTTRYKETPTGDTLEINPAKPLEFKTQAEAKPFKTTVQKEVTRKNMAETITPKMEKITSQPEPKMAKIKPEPEPKMAKITPESITKAKTEKARTDLGVDDTIKDIKGVQKYTKSIYEAAARLPKEVGNKVTSSLDGAKKNYVAHLKKETDALKYVVKDLGIGKGTRESRLVQHFGEKTFAKKYLKDKGIDPDTLTPDEINVINLEQLKKFSPKKWKKIEKADQFFREKYDHLIGEVNKVRAEIYPDNPEKLVPVRDDYYHHFNELNGFEAVKNFFSSPANVETAIEGNFHANSKFQGFMQERGLGKYKADAVGGYLKYLRASAHSINIDPVIPVLRKTAKELKGTEAKNLSKTLDLHANDLAGEINPLDAKLGSLNKTKAWKAVTWLSDRVRTNTVLGNMGTVVAQVGNIPQGIGKAKWSSVSGLTKTMKQTTKEVFRMEKSDPIYQSTFMKERYGDVMFRQFDQKLLDQPKKLAIWLMETTDKQATKFIWNSMHAQAKSKGIKDAMKYADYETRKLVGGRGVGEVPLMQKSKIHQLVSPFTLEVNNQWKVLSEMVGKKEAGSLITTLVASYGLNKIAEEVRGNDGTSFNPIGAVIEGYLKKDGNVSEKALGSLGSLAGEVIGNVGGGNTALELMGNNKIAGTDTKLNDVFGDRNPNRYGSGLLVSKAYTDPIFAAAPFGANQLKKTVKGADALARGGVYKGDSPSFPYTGPKKELSYPINPTTADKLRIPLFGPSASSDAKKHYDGEMKPALNETQTEIYKLLKKEDIDLFEFYRHSDAKPYDKSKITKIGKDTKLSNEQKVRKVKEVLASLTK